MRYLALVLAFLGLLVAGCSAGEEPVAPWLGEPPVGVLGYPAGYYLTVEGITVHRMGKGKPVETFLKVTRVNGEALSAPREIRLRNVDTKEGKRLVVKGFEDFELKGDVPQAVLAYDVESGKNPDDNWSLAQRGYKRTPWYMVFDLVVLKAVEPKELAVTKWEPAHR